MHMVRNPIYHVRRKHIRVRYNYIKIVLEDGMPILEKILDSQNLADMLTKIISFKKLKLCVTSDGPLYK